MAVLAALGLLDANDLLRAVDMLDLQPHHLARTQSAAIAETEENAGLEAAEDGQQAGRRFNLQDRAPRSLSMISAAVTALAVVPTASTASYRAAIFCFPPSRLSAASHKFGRDWRLADIDRNVLSCAVTGRQSDARRGNEPTRLYRELGGMAAWPIWRA